MKKQTRHEERANRQTCQTLLNCYIRELDAETLELFTFDVQTGTYEISFPASGISLKGKMRYSPIGEHDYDSFQVGCCRPLLSNDLGRWIVKEVHGYLDGITDEMEEAFHKRIDNSCDNMTLFIRERGDVQVGDYLSSEQSLLFGHPFHPYPKNRIGFEKKDVAHFAPELLACFQLCYLAVRNDVFYEEWLPGSEEVGPHEQVLALAREVLGELAVNYRLLPVHPWQYSRVHLVEVIQAYIRDGIIVPLGPSGPVAYPTSSVRTVYVPEMKCNLKLPLDIQITNLKRNNTQEQMRRTMDAARYVKQRGCFEQEPNTMVASEEGIQSVRLGNEAAEALLTVAYRPVHFNTDSTFVLASLAEAPVYEGSSRLSRVMEQSQTEQWVHRYLDISLLPIVRLAGEKGIHFEAHLQNSLVTVRKGMPDTFIIRDLEGVSIERDLAICGTDTSGPLFYSREQAWARTAYYFIVNHLGSLLHAIARDMAVCETRLWEIVSEKLEQEYKENGNEYAHYLLTAESFPAKRNLVSCLIGKGEIPSYAAVRNPMKSRESEHIESGHQLV